MKRRLLALWRLAVELFRHAGSAALGRTAAQLAFYSLFALFPALLMLVSLAAYVPLEGLVEGLLSRARPVLPPDGYAIIDTHVHEVVRERQPRLLSLGFVLSLWSASRAIDAMRVALNRANGVTESRSLLRRQAMAFGATLGLMLLLLVGFALLLLGTRAGSALAGELGLGAEWASVLPWLRWPLTFAVVLLAAALCYAVVPDVKFRFRFASPGAVLATAAWLAATWAFTAWAERLDHFNLAYGSIGGVMVLLAWLYFTGLLFLLGAQLDALRAGHQKKALTTEPDEAAALER